MSEHINPLIANEVRLACYKAVQIYNKNKRGRKRLGGILQVTNVASPELPALTYPIGQVETDRPHEELSRRTDLLISTELVNGLTSGARGQLANDGGAVFAAGFVYCFVAGQSNEVDGKRDEAIVLVTAVLAGLLNERSVRTQRCVPGSPGFNPVLRRLMDQLPTKKSTS